MSFFGAFVWQITCLHSFTAEQRETEYTERNHLGSIQLPRLPRSQTEMDESLQSVQTTTQRERNPANYTGLKKMNLKYNQSLAEPVSDLQSVQLHILALNSWK